MGVIKWGTFRRFLFEVGYSMAALARTNDQRPWRLLRLKESEKSDENGLAHIGIVISSISP